MNQMDSSFPKNTSDFVSNDKVFDRVLVQEGSQGIHSYCQGGCKPYCQESDECFEYPCADIEIRTGEYASFSGDVKAVDFFSTFSCQDSSCNQFWGFDFTDNGMMNTAANWDHDAPDFEECTHNQQKNQGSSLVPVLHQAADDDSVDCLERLAIELFGTTCYTPLENERMPQIENIPMTVDHLHMITSQSPYARPNEEPRTSRRGIHVREHPEMQRMVWNGTVHWAMQLRVVRAAWTARSFSSPDFQTRFASQVESAQGQVKAKQECLLRYLQMAAADAIIEVWPFLQGNGFFGWTRFIVVRDLADEFRTGLAALFPMGFKEESLKETFRRAGLVPERFQWEQGWRGEVAFEYRPSGKRV